MQNIRSAKRMSLCRKLKLKAKEAFKMTQQREIPALTTERRNSTRNKTGRQCARNILKCLREAEVDEESILCPRLFDGRSNS